MGAHVGRDGVGEAESAAEGRRPAAGGSPALAPAPMGARRDVASILRWQSAAGNQATIRELGRQALRPRSVARCGSHCSCVSCSHEDLSEEPEDGLSSSLRRAVLARAAATGVDHASAGRPVLQRQADAGVENGDAGAGADPAIRDAGESLPGGVSQPPPLPTPPTPRDGCRVEVRNTHIGGSLGWAPIWHLYIVHTDETGRRTGWRGGPGGHGAGGTYGSIIGTTGAYAPGFIDWDPDSDSVTVAAGEGACGKTACFAGELRRIDATKTPYNPTGPNSNTWVRTVLHNCGLREDKPVWIAPGFGDPYL